jgi:hypothetical protein
MKTLYVAGPSSDAAMVARFAAGLDAFGWEICFPWWPDFVDGKILSGKDRIRTKESRRADAVQCLAGVYRAQYLWLLVPGPESGSVGSWVELGAAFAHPDKKHVIVSGDHLRTSFLEIADRHFDTHEEARRWLEVNGDPS